MNNTQKHFKHKALGMVRGPGTAHSDSVHNVSLSAGEAVLPAETVQKSGGAMAIQKLIRQTTGKQPKRTLHDGGKYADGFVQKPTYPVGNMTPQQPVLQPIIEAGQAAGRLPPPAPTPVGVTAAALPPTGIPNNGAHIAPLPLENPAAAAPAKIATPAAAIAPEMVTPSVGPKPPSLLSVEGLKSAPGRAWEAAKGMLPGGETSAPAAEAAPKLSAMDRAAAMAAKPVDLVADMKAAGTAAIDSVKPAAKMGGNMLAGAMNVLNSPVARVGGGVLGAVQGVRDLNNDRTLRGVGQFGVDLAGMSHPIISAADAGARVATHALGANINGNAMGAGQVIDDAFAGENSQIANAKAARANDGQNHPWLNMPWEEGGLFNKLAQKPVAAAAAPGVAASDAVMPKPTGVGYGQTPIPTQPAVDLTQPHEASLGVGAQLVAGPATPSVSSSRDKNGNLVITNTPGFAERAQAKPAEGTPEKPETAPQTLKRLQAENAHATKHGNLDDRIAAAANLGTFLRQDAHQVQREASANTLAANQARLGWEQSQAAAEKADKHFDKIYTKPGKPGEADIADTTRNLAFKNYVESSLASLNKPKYSQLSPVDQLAVLSQYKPMFETSQAASSGGIKLDTPGASDINATEPTWGQVLSPERGTATLGNKLWGWKLNGDNRWVQVGGNQKRMHELTDDGGMINRERETMIKQRAGLK